MGYSTFGDDALAHAVGSHFYTIEEFVRQHYDDLANEDNMCGSLQALLMVDVMIDKLKDAYRKTGYQLDVEFVAKKDRTEPETGVDLSLLLKIYTHPMQTVEGFRDVGFFARNQKKKSLLVQTKNLRTTYGTTVRSDQLANLAERTENGGVVWWLSRKGIEVASVNDLLE